MSFYVYVHTNKINGKKYVGITRLKLTTRWKNGKGYEHNKHLTLSIEKYGWENFEHQVFEVDTESEMFYLEQYLISYYETTDQDKGYNYSIGGEGGNYKGIGIDGYKQYNKEYQKQHRNKYSDYYRDYLKKWRKENPEKAKQYWQKSNFNRKLKKKINQEVI